VYGRIVWQPSAERIARSRITAFLSQVEQTWRAGACDYPSLYRFSIEQPGKFWQSVWDFCGVIGERGDGPVVTDIGRMPGARWFPGARLNYAENLLRRGDETVDGIVLRCEDRPAQRMSFRELAQRVSRFSQALEHAGVRPGDRVAAYMPNIPDTTVAFLAAAKLGAIWSVCSTDLGADAVVERFGQIEPSVLFVADGARYEGKRFPAFPAAGEIARRLSALRKVVVVPYLDPSPAHAIPGAVSLDEFLAPFPARPLSFERFPFQHPLCIVYTSGTTGRPKCIIHSAGGSLIQHMKEHQLHFDIAPGDRIFRTTTSGWILWNSLVSALASGATIVMADGSPMHPRLDILFDFIEQEQLAFAGIPPKVIDTLRKAGVRPRETHNLGSLKCIAAGGARLTPENYVYAYEHISADFQLTSPCGGTDINAFFAGGNPIGPCRAGEIQAIALGMKVEIFDEDATPVVGRPGELVCTQSFPSIPLGFWNDPDGARYRQAYFDRWPGVWRHGDWAELTPHGGLIPHGRSDTTLNARGVRIGTAEIYRQMEAFPEVLDSVVVAQEWDGDYRVLLFVQLAPGHALDRRLEDRIRTQIRERASPRHVPDRIVQVPDIPRTTNGKVSEAAVRDAIHGREVLNQHALANSAALAFFSDPAILGSATMERT
jgi:acetoacetyl-CoA synthetase